MHALPAYMNFRKNHDADIIMQKIMIENSVPCTFYSLLNWNAGEKEILSGYAGFQCLCDNSKTVHFSILNPEKTENFKSLSLIGNCSEEPFFGEGEGKKFVWPFDYKDGQWYQLSVKADISSQYFTIVSCELKECESGIIYSIASVQYPIPKAIFRHSYGSFIEDFNNSESRERSFFLKGGYSKVVNTQKWISWDEQEFSFNSSDGRTHVNGGTQNNNFFIASGGNTQLEVGNYSMHKISQPSVPA